MRKKLALILTMLAVVIGSLSEARAALASQPAAASRGRTPVSVAPDVLPGTTIQPRHEDTSPHPVYAYVASDVLSAGTVTPIAAATGRRGTPIPVGKDPVALAETPDDKTVYVANDGSGTVTPIATATKTAGKPITVGYYPHAIAITPDGATAYVASYDGTVTPIATATNTVGPPIEVGDEPAAIAITPDGTTAYVANNVVSGTVTPIALATRTAGKPIRVGSKPVAIAIAPDGSTVYVANLASGTVTPVSTATGVAGKAIAVGDEPEGIAITPNGNTVYVANYGSDTVTPIAAATGTAGPPIRVGIHPEQIAITPDGATAYVANSGSGTQTPITTATNKAGRPIPVPGGAGAITINPPPQVPAAPRGLTAALVGSAVSLTWTNSAAAGAATGTTIQRATDAGFTKNVTDIRVGPTATSYTDASVVVGTRYYYRVQAQNQVGKSAWSNAVSILISLPAPANLTARAYATGNARASVVLTWTESHSAKVTWFVVELATNARFTRGFAWVRVGRGDRSITLAGLLRNQRYYVRILAVDWPVSSSWTTLTITTPGWPACRPGQRSTYPPGSAACPPRRPRSP